MTTISANEGTHEQPQGRGRSRAGWWVIGIAAVALIVATAPMALGWYGPLAGNRGRQAMPTFEVKRGPLTISVTESGTVRARDQVIVSSEVEGRVSIISLVEEGTFVEKGDLLIELDRSGLEDQKIEQEIRLLNTEAALIRAQEQLEVTRSQAESDVARAQLDLEFAQQDLRKYLEGDYLQQLKERQQRITLANEEVTRAQDRLEGSERLFEERYISQTELNSDRLALMRAQLELEVAEEELRLFEAFTHPRQVRLLESELEQAEMAMERVRRRARSDVVQAEADLRAKESEHNQQQSRVARIESQIRKCNLYAPTSGMVVYATSMQVSRRGNVEPLEAGHEVREREELIYLPTTDSMMVELKIHESSLEKVRIGQRVRVEFDALPGRTYWGRVTRIAQTPDQQSVWMNPDLTVFATDVVLDGSDEEIRTGMTCRAQIIVEQHRDVLHVPVQSVVRRNGEPTVYVWDGQRAEPRVVRIGLDNNHMAHLIEGLSEGDRVLLAPPLTDATPLHANDVDTDDAPPAAPASPPAASGPGERSGENARSGGAGAEERPRGERATRGDGAQRERGGAGGGGGDRAGRADLTPEQREALRNQRRQQNQE